jgi:hypothetical protein
MDANSHHETAATAVGFDEKALLADLKAWWDEQVGNDDPFAPPKLAPGTIMDVLPEVDSLAVVTALIVMEGHLPCEVPPSVIRPGGYHSFEDMCQDLMPKLKALNEKHSKTKGAISPKKETA